MLGGVFLGQKRKKITKKERKLINSPVLNNLLDYSMADYIIGDENPDDGLTHYTEYICSNCGIHENIPTHIVMNFEYMHSGDKDYWPTFTCEKCNGLMYPVYFKGYTGKIYEYKLKD